MALSPERKVKSLHELAKLIAALKRQGKRIVQCHGVFDLIHPGHIRHFKSAKKEGDVLVVTLTADRHVKRGPGRPIFNEHLRAEALSALAVVDFVCVLDFPTAVEGILAVKPDVYAKGPDYKNRKSDVTGKILDEEAAVKSVGGKIVITDDVVFSSSSLINRHLEVYPKETVKYLKDLSARYSIESVIAHVAKIKKLKVLVIGDAIIDQYYYCTALGKSSKESIVVHKHLSEESFAGGALATANHTAELSGPLDFLTVLGKKNSFAKFISQHLGRNIRAKYIYRPDAGTTVKRRFVNLEENGKKLFEVCFLNDTPLSEAKENEVLSFLRARIKKYDLVIAADFGHGLMTQKIIRFLCQNAKSLALNVQTNSANIGFNLVTKYPRADFVCIDEHELRLATHDRHTDLRALVKRIYRQLQSKQVMVTRGRDGSLSYSGRSGFHQCPAFSYHVVDKVGAGDAFFAVTAPCFAAGLAEDLVSFIGNAAGSLAVQIVCNREPVRLPDLVKFMTRLMKF